MYTLCSDSSSNNLPFYLPSFLVRFLSFGEFPFRHFLISYPPPYLLGGTSHLPSTPLRRPSPRLRSAVFRNRDSPPQTRKSTHTTLRRISRIRPRPISVSTQTGFSNNADPNPLPVLPLSSVPRFLLLQGYTEISRGRSLHPPPCRSR